MNAILVGLPCQPLHLVGKLRGAYEYRIQLDTEITYALTLDLPESLLGGCLLVITAARDSRRTPATS